MTEEELVAMAKQMHAIGLQQVLLQKTLAAEVDQFELAALQGKDPKVIEDHYIRCSVAFEGLMDKKRQLADLTRKWAIAKTGGKQ